jgi:hypothetical protein
MDKNEVSMKIKIAVLVVFLFIVYGQLGDFFEPIRPIHEWRKTDSFSIALNYMNGNSFLQPETQYISAYNNRAAAGEFPIVYYIVGKIWSLFGQHEWIGKILTYLILYTALILFSEVLHYFFRSEKKTILFTATILSSPVLLFYSNTILPNLYSFSFLLIAAYLIYKYLTRPKWYQVALLVFFLTLAVLIKITALIAILTFAGAAVVHYGLIKKEIFSLYRKHTVVFAMSLLIALLCTWQWYSYAIRYNEFYHSDLFSTVVRPIWEVSANDIRRIWTSIWKYQFNLIFHLSVMLPIICVIIYGLFRGRIRGFLLFALIFGSIGVCSYICLWFWALEVHDYYLIEILFFPLLLLFIIFREFDKYFLRAKWMKMVLLYFFFIITFTHALAYSQTSHGKNNIITRNNILLSSHIRGNWWYFNDHYNTHLGKLQIHLDDVRKVILQSDTVVCINDPSPNIQLYTVGRFGITRMGFNRDLSDSTMIAALIERGADKVLKVGEECADTTAHFFFTDTLLSQDGIYVFDLARYKRPKS